MKVTYPSFVRFLRQQSVYIALSAVVGAIFWAIGQPINPSTVMIYTLCLGNLLTPSMARVRPVYAERPFPYNWLVFLPILMVMVLPVYLISSIFVWVIAPPTPQTYEHLIRTGWKLPFLITFVYGVLSFLYYSTKERLERRNVELQHSVELGTAQLELQEQELRRAQEIQRSLLPETLPKIPGFELAAHYQTSARAGGDYYDFFQLEDGKWGLFIADVSGHGTPAAVLMAITHAIAHAQPHCQTPPATMLR